MNYIMGKKKNTAYKTRFLICMCKEAHECTILAFPAISSVLVTQKRFLLLYFTAEISWLCPLLQGR